MSLRYLEGAEVDYKEDLMGGGFAIKNPNATSTCGCGHSFTRGRRRRPNTLSLRAGRVPEAGPHRGDDSSAHPPLPPPQRRPLSPDAACRCTSSSRGIARWWRTRWTGHRTIGMTLLLPGWEADYQGRPAIFPIGCAGPHRAAASPSSTAATTSCCAGSARFRVRRGARRASPTASPRSSPWPKARGTRPRLEGLRERLMAAIGEATDGPATLVLQERAAPRALRERAVPVAEPGPGRESQSLLDCDTVVARCCAPARDPGLPDPRADLRQGALGPLRRYRFSSIRARVFPSVSLKKPIHSSWSGILATRWGSPWKTTPRAFRDAAVPSMSATL